MSDIPHSDPDLSPSSKIGPNLRHRPEDPEEAGFRDRNCQHNYIQFVIQHFLTLIQSSLSAKFLLTRHRQRAYDELDAFAELAVKR